MAYFNVLFSKNNSVDIENIALQKTFENLKQTILE